MYEQAPYGSNIWLTEDNGKIVGQYSYIFMYFKFDDSIIKAAHSINSMTHPDYRQRGIYLTMKKYAISTMLDTGARFTYGFPNNLSYPLNIKLGFSPIANMAKMKRVFNWKNSLKNRINNKPILQLGTASGNLLNKLIFRGSKIRGDKDLAITQVTSFDERIDDFWNRVSNQGKIIAIKNTEFLNWRYVFVPDASYSIFIAEKEKTVEGYLVLRYYQRENVNVAVIFDLLAGSREVAECLIATINEKCQRDGIDYIYWVGLHNKMYFEAFRRQGFFHQPFEKGRSCVVFSTDTSISGAFLTNSKNWIIQSGDTDE